MALPYDLIFVTNILRRLQELGMTKKDLSDATGISLSYLSDITHGQANPSLATMVAIAEAIDTPLAFLLERTDLDPSVIEELGGGRRGASLPEGYERVCVLLTEPQAFQARKWDLANRRKLGF